MISHSFPKETYFFSLTANEYDCALSLACLGVAAAGVLALTSGMVSRPMTSRIEKGKPDRHEFAFFEPLPTCYVVKHGSMTADSSEVSLVLSSAGS